MLFLTTTLAGQNQVIIYESPRPMSKSNQNAYLVHIPQAKLKSVTKKWIRYIANGSNGKMSHINGEYKQNEAINRNISPQPFTIYSTILQTTSDVKLTVWFCDSEMRFFSKERTPDQDLAIRKFLYDFAILEYQFAVNDELKTEQDKVISMENSLRKLIKSEELSIKKIGNKQRSIHSAHDAIITNDEDIQLLNIKISYEKRMINGTMMDFNASQGAQKTLRSLEQAKKNIQKKNQTHLKNIDRWNMEIREEERNILMSQQSQSFKTNSIEQQKLVVRQVQLKLDHIE